MQAVLLMHALEEREGIELEYLPFPPNVPGPLRLLQRPRFIRTVFNSLAFLTTLLTRIWKVDVIHTFTASHFAFLLAPAPTLAVARLLGKKSILHYHDGRAEAHLRDWKSTRRLIRIADVVGLFKNLESPEVTDNLALFDFDGDGVIGFGDVIRLFEQLLVA